MSTLFSLDDATKSIERGSLDEGISAMLGVLDEAWVVLRDIIIPNGRVRLIFHLALFLSSCIFVFLTLVFFPVPHCS